MLSTSVKKKLLQPILNQKLMKTILLSLLTLLCLINFSISSTAQVATPKQKKGKWGLLYENKKVVDFIYDEINRDNISGSFLARKGDQWGVFNLTGDQIIPCQYASVEHWNSGYYIVSQQGKYGLYQITQTSKAQLPLIYDDIKKSTEERGVLMVTYNGKTGRMYSDKNIIFSDAGKAGLMTVEGTTLIPFEYESIEYYRKGVYKLKQDNKCGFYKVGEDNEIPECRYEDIDRCSSKDPNLKVKVDGKYGLVDEDDNTVLAFEYDSIRCAQKEFYYLLKDGKHAWFDAQKPDNKPVLKYDNIDHIKRKGLTGTVKLNGKWVTLKEGVVNTSAERVEFTNPESRAYFIDCDNLSPEDASEMSCADKKMLEFIYGNVNYPTVARENGIEGMVVISFVVSPQGEVSDAEVIREIGGGCGKEAKKLVEGMPKWVLPAEQDGQKVWMRFNLPVRFMLTN